VKGENSAAAGVVAIHRYPLKSAAAEHIDETIIGKHGLEGDRTWTCLDADGTIGSAKQPRLWAPLLEVKTTYSNNRVTVQIPNSEPLAAGSTEAEEALSTWLGRPVQLTRLAPQQLRRHHWWPDEPGMIPEWAADAEPGSEAMVDVRATDGRFFDFGAVHLVTTGALDQLSSEHGRQVDPIRFRPNLILDLPSDPEPGQRIEIGPDLILQVVVPTPRCVIPSLAHGRDPADRTLLKTLAGHHRRDVPGFGRASCFGFYAEVIAEGKVNTGDRMNVTSEKIDPRR
jgi:uncharacterized protein YcbX